MVGIPSPIKKKCSTMVNETVQYYTENGVKPVYDTA